MATLVNPRIELRVFTDIPTVITEPYIDYDIVKDLDDEANEAELRIYNLNSDTRSLLAAAENQYMPIEIRLTPSGSNELALAFKGEIEYAKNMKLRPGHETRLHCTSQQINHRGFPVSREFAAGTPVAAIMIYLIQTIGLPRGDRTQLPTSVSLLSQSMSGPAFPLLKKYLNDFGMSAYILDNKLYVSNVYVAPDPVPIKIFGSNLLSDPQETNRIDAEDVMVRTFAEVTADNTRRSYRKKQTRRTKKYDLNDQPAEYDAVDMSIAGMDFELLLQPQIQPDNILTFIWPSLISKLFRTKMVHHYGNNETFDDWTTELETDLYDIGWI